MPPATKNIKIHLPNHPNKPAIMGATNSQSINAIIKNGIVIGMVIILRILMVRHK
ncbi:hypothetical protein [Mesomycoplasma ovipneumoniae]|uniref:hypothetical protein n=1 Tax=Mesomycoplasma ovipneumoniae TaxID=29562 RepID=UPI0004B180DD|nr:hypothetical protein [Mesomycoplasma ovipneumoniae]